MLLQALAIVGMDESDQRIAARNDTARLETEDVIEFFGPFGHAGPYVVVETADRGEALRARQLLVAAVKRDLVAPGLRDAAKLEGGDGNEDQRKQRGGPHHRVLAPVEIRENVGPGGAGEHHELVFGQGAIGVETIDAIDRRRGFVIAIGRLREGRHEARLGDALAGKLGGTTRAADHVENHEVAADNAEAAVLADGKIAEEAA